MVATVSQKDWRRHLSTKGKRKKFRRKAQKRLRRMRKNLMEKGLLESFVHQTYTNGEWVNRRYFTTQSKAAQYTVNKQTGGYRSSRLIDMHWQERKRRSPIVVYPVIS